MPPSEYAESSAEKRAAEPKLIPLPTLTHLQFLVLDVVFHSPSGISAAQLQKAMTMHGPNHRGPKFYQLMKRLEDAGLIESWYQDFDVGGSDVKRTYYKLAKDGLIAREITIRFYETRMKVDADVTRESE